MSSVRTGGRGAAETEFGYPEHLLVWTWRRIATGRAGCPLIAAEFTDACGDDAGEVFATFCTFLRALAHSGRGGLRVGPPGCRAITADERRLLTLIARRRPTSARYSRRIFAGSHAPSTGRRWPLRRARWPPRSPRTICCWRRRPPFRR